MRTDRKRLAVEGLTIVASILLAFWIDASWDGRVERQRASELLAAIRSDVLVTQEHIRSHSDRTGQITSDARALLEALAEGPDSPVRDSLLLTTGSIFVHFIWNPVNHSYEQALGSGSFELVRDQELRLALGEYVGALDRVGFWAEVMRQQYQGELEPFMVAHTVYSESAAPDVREELVQGPYRTDLDALASSRELWNLLTLKLEVEAIARVALREASLKAEALLSQLPPGP
jgi:hypothetical protein